MKTAENVMRDAYNENLQSSRFALTLLLRLLALRACGIALKVVRAFEL